MEYFFCNGICGPTSKIVLLPVSEVVFWSLKHKLAYLFIGLMIARVQCIFDMNNGLQQYNSNQYAFEREVCRERWTRLDWQYILRPCIDRTKFGSNRLPSHLATNSRMSRIVKMDIQQAGEYSTLTIQTYDTLGQIKMIGGDTWRAFIVGPSAIQPLVHDMANGLYEIPFLILEPGLYKADIYLEGTLCNQFFDPPFDWFKKGDYNGHFQEDHMYKNYSGWPNMLRKRMWERIGGNENMVQFIIYPKDEMRYRGNMEKLRSWKALCNIPQSCNFLWDGFGRWVGSSWKPYNEYEGMASQANLHEIANAKKHKAGILLFYGDCFAHQFYGMEKNFTLCRNIFQKCMEKYNWVYPRLNADSSLDPTIHKKDSSDISIDKISSYLHKAFKESQKNKYSAAIVNFGLHLARSTSFEKYKQLITKIKDVFKKYPGKAIWRTTTSVWQQQAKIHKRFQTYQRVQLFNAYSMSAMCDAGVPILDVFPLTSSTPKQPQDGIHYENDVLKPIENVLIHYFKDDL